MIRDIWLPHGIVVAVDRPLRIVVTHFADGAVVPATRDATPENIAQAAEQGYSPDAEGVWNSLVEHEVLHHLISDWLWMAESPTLRFEAQPSKPALYGTRLYEEGMVISFQRMLNLDTEEPPWIGMSYGHLLRRARLTLGRVAPGAPVEAEVPG